MKKRFILHGCLLLIVVAVGGFAAAGFRPDVSVYVKGVVTQSDRPVRSVWVIASQSGTEKGRALTGDDGKYYIGNMSGGDYDSGQIHLPEDRVFNISITSPRAPRSRR